VEEGNLITMERRIITTDVLEEDVKIEGSPAPGRLHRTGKDEKEPESIY